MNLPHRAEMIANYSIKVCTPLFASSNSSFTRISAPAPANVPTLEFEYPSYKNPTYKNPTYKKASSPQTQTQTQTNTKSTPDTPSGFYNWDKSHTSPFLKNYNPSGQTLNNISSFPVSQHYRVDHNEILSYLDRKGFYYRVSGDEIILKYCPFDCTDTKGRVDNLWKVYIHKFSGAWLCHRCGAKGSWFDFRRRQGDMFSFSNEQDEKQFGHLFKEGPDPHLFEQDQDSTPTSPVPYKSITRYQDSLIENPKFKNAAEYLVKERGIDPIIIKKYKVGAQEFRFQNPETEEWEPHNCLVFPWLDSPKTTKIAATNTTKTTNECSVNRIKIRSLQGKEFQRLAPLSADGGKWGFFGWHLVKPTDKEIIITEGEFDALAVASAIHNIPVVSLPNGANSFPVSLIPKLERFSKIYLWMDSDPAGQEGAACLAKKLGPGRCHIVPSYLSSLSPTTSSEAETTTSSEAETTKPPKDANEALLAGFDLKQLFNAASPVPHHQIITFDEMKDGIFQELLNPIQVQGVQYIWLPGLNKILKGFRRGELTILTGPTGVGKTTILSQLSTDLASQGVPTLWGSFEIQNIRLARKMLSQFSNSNLEANPVSEFTKHAEKFSQLPLYFLRFYGSTQVEDVLEAMEYSVYVNNVQHIVIDNLQFMTSGQSKGFDKFDLLDSAIAKFRNFASSNNVHITVVVHPRKEVDGLPLTTSSVFGSAKATQEADNVIIVQKIQAPAHIRSDQQLVSSSLNKESKIFLEVTKNRFDGTLGSLSLKFDPVTQKLYEIE